MRQFAALALVGTLLVVTQPMLRAQDRKAAQERAIAEIKKMGGKVEVDTQSPDITVLGVNLKHTKVMDASLEHLKELTKLQILYLKDTQVTDNGMVYLKGLTNIEALELGRTRVTDKGLEHLKGFIRLQRLDLAGTQVTDKGLEHLKGLRQLQTLDLSGTRVTDAGVEDLQMALPKVKIVR
jgi:Leucine-rich repeat (LRR) protein